MLPRRCTPAQISEPERGRSTRPFTNATSDSARSKPKVRVDVAGRSARRAQIQARIELPTSVKLCRASAMRARLPVRTPATASAMVMTTLRTMAEPSAVAVTAPPWSCGCAPVIGDSLDGLIAPLLRARPRSHRPI